MTLHNGTARVSKNLDGRVVVGFYVPNRKGMTYPWRYMQRRARTLAHGVEVAANLGATKVFLPSHQAALPLARARVLVARAK